METEDTSVPTEPQRAFEIIRTRRWTNEEGEKVQLTVRSLNVKNAIQ
jgi:hypothetical protein